jgi:hypothetical protein
MTPLPFVDELVDGGGPATWRARYASNGASPDRQKLLDLCHRLFGIEHYCTADYADPLILILRDYCWGFSSSPFDNLYNHKRYEDASPVASRWRKFRLVLPPSVPLNESRPLAMDVSPDEDSFALFLQTLQELALLLRAALERRITQLLEWIACLARKAEKAKECQELFAQRFGRLLGEWLTALPLENLALAFSGHLAIAAAFAPLAADDTAHLPVLYPRSPSVG